MNRNHKTIRRIKRIYDKKNKYIMFKDIFLFSSIFFYKMYIKKENDELKQKINRMKYLLNF